MKKMKYLKNIIIAALVLMFISTGCNTDKLHDLNINPQSVSEIDVNYMFTGAQLSLASNGTSGDNRYTDWRTNIRLCSNYIQQLTWFSWPGNRYEHYEEGNQSIFQFSYQDQLKNLAEVIKQTGEGGFAEGTKKNTREAARIVRALAYFRLTDFYGSIPYYEANQGIEGIFFPVYDNQSTIYPDLLNELSEAVAGLSTGNPDEGFASADMIYQGDIAKWKKWGNSLILRYAMRASNVDANLANSYVSQAVSGGVFESNDDNVWIPMALGPSTWSNQNGISRAFYPGDGGENNILGEALINFLKGSDPNSTADDDPRLMIFSGGIADWTANDWLPIDTDPLNQRGIPQGYTQSETAAILGLDPNFNPYQTFSRINFLMMQDDDPYMIMAHAEVEFLLAEAAERGIGGVTNAQAHYEAGVRSAMQMYTPFDPSFAVDDPTVDAYLATYPYGGGGVTGGESNLEQIGWQLWASHWMNWYDAWTDWRRTDLPPLVERTTSQAPVTPGTIPVRLAYPQTEIASNPNFDQNSKSNYTSPVWWDGGSE
jgi:hypothetical protein